MQLCDSCRLSCFVICDLQGGSPGKSRRRFRSRKKRVAGHLILVNLAQSQLKQRIREIQLSDKIIVIRVTPRNSSAVCPASGRIAETRASIYKAMPLFFFLLPMDLFLCETTMSRIYFVLSMWLFFSTASSRKLEGLSLDRVFPVIVSLPLRSLLLCLFHRLSVESRQ